MNLQQKPLFTKRALFALVWPLVMEQLLNALVGMVDVLMVSSVGETAVSGVSLVDAVNVLMFQFMAALSTGGAVICSRFIGMRDETQARLAAGQLMSVSVTVSAVLTLLCLLGGRSLLGLIFGSVETGVMDNAVLYFRLTVLSYPFLAVYNSGAAISRSTGDSRSPMLVSLLMNAVNVAGNAVCIFWLRMGVAGVALPTLFSRMLAAVLMMAVIQRKGSRLRLEKQNLLAFRSDMIRSILSVGIPNGIETSMFQFGKLMLSSLVSTLGTAAIAGYAVAGNLVTFEYLPGVAMGMGLLTVVGQCIGAGEYEQAKKYTRLLMLVDYVLLFLYCIPIFWKADAIVGLYSLSDESLVIAAGMLRIHTAGMIIWPPAFMIPYAFRAGYDQKFVMFWSVLIMWVVRTLGAYFAVRVLKLGPYGIWYAMMADWACRFVIMLLRFRQFSDRTRAAASP